MRDLHQPDPQGRRESARPQLEGEEDPRRPGSTKGFRLACQLWIHHDIELTQEIRSTPRARPKAPLAAGVETTITRVIPMYVVLTNKPGEFRTEITAGLKAVESYDYIFYGRKRGEFHDRRAAEASKIRIVEDEPPQIVNDVPSKLFEKFETLDEARAELNTLTHYGTMDIKLKRCERPRPARRSRGGSSR